MTLHQLLMLASKVHQRRNTVFIAFAFSDWTNMQNLQGKRKNGNGHINVDLNQIREF